MKKTLKIFLLGIITSLCVLFVPQVSEAKSVNWNYTDSSGTYFYKFGWFGYQQYGIPSNTGSSGYVKALENPHYTITYGANVYNQSTGGQLLADNAVIPVGTSLRFSPKTFASSDISWFGTGFSGDSPNGDWVNNADPSHDSPNDAGSADFSYCRNQDYVGNVPANTGGNWDVYIPLSINPPAVSINHAGTAGLTCNGSGTDCTVTSPGTIVSNFVFQNTYGKLYYRYANTSRYLATNPLANPASCSSFTNVSPIEVDDGSGTQQQPCYFYITGCFGDNSPLRKNCSNQTCSNPDYELPVPQQTISFNFSVPGPANNPPNPPVITGSTTGNPNSPQSFNFQATDPDNDTLRYGVDWDTNGSVDAWLPGSGFVATNTVQPGNYSWITPGTYSFQALTQDSNGANSGWTSYSITITAPPAVPTADITINGSNGPLAVTLASNLALSWNSANATNCTAYGAGWGSATPVAVNGTQNITANQGDTYILQCTGPGGSATDQVVVTLSNSLKVCQNSCSSGITRGTTSSTQSFSLAQGGTQNLVSCFNPSSSCNDGNGDVTSSTTWGEGGGSTISLSGINPKVVTGNSAGTEGISASYSSQTANINVSVTCLPTVSCANAPGAENYCQNQTFNVDNGCGVSISCNGTKTCNYNWKEVAP